MTLFPLRMSTCLNAVANFCIMTSSDLADFSLFGSF